MCLASQLDDSPPFGAGIGNVQVAANRAAFGVRGDRV